MKRIRRSNKGIMRIIEAIIACAIIIIGIVATTQFSSGNISASGEELQEVSNKVIDVIGNPNVIKDVVLDNGNWRANLESLLSTLLPLDTYYSLSLTSELTGDNIANLTNMEGESSSSDMNLVSNSKVITISLPLALSEDKELDVILIIDKSGSMNDKEPGDEYSKIDYAKQAAIMFVDQLDQSKDKIGLVTFSTEASLDIGLTDNFASVKSSVNSIDAGGWTNLGDAIKFANDEFVANQRIDAIQAMIILTDGVTNRPIDEEYAKQYSYEKAAEADALGFFIYTIGLGADTGEFDEELLVEIQNKGYYYAPSAEDLTEIYYAIVQDLLFAVKFDIIKIDLVIGGSN